MTAFAHIEKHGIAWEIRSVNHRYLEIAFRMPEFYAYWNQNFELC